MQFLGRSCCFANFTSTLMIPILLVIVAFLVSSTWLETSVPSPRISSTICRLKIHWMEIGTRVPGCSQAGGNAPTNTSMVHTTHTKPCEVWAMVGSGHSLSPSRCKLVKRTWTRACRRAVRDGHTLYRGRTLWAHEVPMRFRVFAPSEDPPRLVVASSRNLRTAEELRVFCWNAGNVSSMTNGFFGAINAAMTSCSFRRQAGHFPISGKLPIGPVFTLHIVVLHNC